MGMENFFNKFFFFYFFVFSKSIVTIIDTIQFFPKDKTCLGFSRVNVRRTIGDSHTDARHDFDEHNCDYRILHSHFLKIGSSGHSPV